MSEASSAPPPCPRCGASHVVRNGANSAGTPTFRCRGCGRRFVAAPAKGPVPDDQKAVVERLLAERVGVRAIARITGRSRSWVQRFVNALFREGTPWEPGPLKKTGPLTIECDEPWSFAGSRNCQWWAWVARDAATRQVVAMVAGDRSAATARCRWDALPAEYRGGAVVCTDFGPAYRDAVPAERHAAVPKDAGTTCHVERFWATVRARVRAVRAEGPVVLEVRVEPRRLTLVLHLKLQRMPLIGPLPTTRSSITAKGRPRSCCDRSRRRWGNRGWGGATTTTKSGCSSTCWNSSS